MREALIYDWQRPGLGDEFLDEVTTSLTRIKEFPFAHPPLDGSRRYILRRFPFSLIYEVEVDIIVIVAVAHHSRRPRYWKRRLRKER
jgi:toxin ParE1/3/4